MQTNYQDFPRSENVKTFPQRAKTHGSAIFGPGDGRGGNTKGVTDQGERLLKGDSEV